jgi:hypothetical protein
MRSEIGKFKRIGPRRKDILVVILWTAAISLIMIKAYMLFYLHSPLGQEFWVVYDWPGLEWYDMVILTVLSIACTMILSDAESIVYGFAASLILSFIISVTYVSIFIWYVVGAEPFFSQVTYGWEYVLYAGFWNVFFVMVPWIIGTSAIGLVIGILIRAWTKTS